MHGRAVGWWPIYEVQETKCCNLLNKSNIEAFECITQREQKQSPDLHSVVQSLIQKT